MAPSVPRICLQWSWRGNFQAQVDIAMPSLTEYKPIQNPRDMLGEDRRVLLVGETICAEYMHRVSDGVVLGAASRLHCCDYTSALSALAWPQRTWACPLELKITSFGSSVEITFVLLRQLARNKFSLQTFPASQSYTTTWPSLESSVKRQSNASCPWWGKGNSLSLSISSNGLVCCSLSLSCWIIKWCSECWRILTINSFCGY